MNSLRRARRIGEILAGSALAYGAACELEAALFGSHVIAVAFLLALCATPVGMLCRALTRPAWQPGAI